MRPGTHGSATAINCTAHLRNVGAGNSACCGSKHAISARHIRKMTCRGACDGCHGTFNVACLFESRDTRTCSEERGWFDCGVRWARSYVGQQGRVHASAVVAKWDLSKHTWHGRGERARRERVGGVGLVRVSVDARTMQRKERLRNERQLAFQRSHFASRQRTEVVRSIAPEHKQVVVRRER